jgi:hypothetical protein
MKIEDMALYAATLALIVSLTVLAVDIRDLRDRMAAKAMLAEREKGGDQ